MRKTPSALALLAVAALSHADPAATASSVSTLDMSYTTGADVTLSSLTSEDYLHNYVFANRNSAPFTPDPNGAPYLEFDGNNHQTALDYADFNGGDGHSTGHSFGAGSLSFTSSLSSSITANPGHDVYYDRGYGYRAFYTFTNGSATAAEAVTFTVDRQGTNAYAIDRPFDGDAVEGPFAWTDTQGGVTDKTTGLNVLVNDDYFESDQDGLSETVHNSFSGTRSILLAPGETRQFEAYIFSSVVVEDDHAPQAVPEPSALAALGLGALALLRRRKA